MNIIMTMNNLIAAMNTVQCLKLPDVAATQNLSTVLRASCLKLEINEFRCYEAKIEESEKGRQPPGVKPRTPLA